MTFKFVVALDGTPNVLKLVKAMGRMFAMYVCQGFGISTPDPSQLDGLYFSEEEEKNYPSPARNHQRILVDVHDVVHPAEEVEDNGRAEEQQAEVGVDQVEIEGPSVQSPNVDCVYCCAHIHQPCDNIQVQHQEKADQTHIRQPKCP